MEAVPRLPMLSFELKPSAENVEFGPKLRQYIRDHYNEDPDNYSTEIHELEGLRAGAIHAPRDFTGCSTLKRYYCQLHFLLSRFPLTENSSLAITFNWYDVYSSLSYSVTDIKYEMACILYNIGALHTDLGAMDARNTPDGMKISCTHFQCAAWAFQHLRDTYPQPRESDMNPTLLTFFYNVCLAQAQECILEKSMTDNRKPTIIAKVAMQVVEYLKTAMKNLGSAKSADAVITEIVGGKKLKMWRKYCEFKIAYYGAVALLYQGMQTEEQQKMGERLAYYQAAVDMLSEASKLSKNLEKQEDEMNNLNKAAQSMNETDAVELIAESLTFSNDVMGGKLTAAQKENEFVYHEKVPPVSSLAEVKGASLVKGIPFSVNDPEVAGQDIFSKLVPIEAHQHSSMYSEEKAKLLRHICGEIQEKNEELETYLASMQLDSLSLDDNSDALPQELVECCADLNTSNGVRKLSDIMTKISNFYHDIDAQLKAIHNLIEEEEQKEKEFLTMMGKRAPNMILGEMKREANKYREAHQSAQDNNTALHRAITNHMSNLQMLSNPLDQIVASIPSTSEVEAQADPAARQEVKRLLGKVSEMQAQRARWEDQLRRDLHEDDVTKQLVTNQEDMEEFFKNELKKHDKLVIPLQQNMSAQNNILQALSEANAAYATTRRLTNQIQAQRTEVISSLLASYDAYLNIIKKAEDAQEFYHKLEGQVNKLAARVKSVCRVQDEEREEVLSANVKKFTGGAALPKVPGAPMLPSGQPSAMNPTSASSASGPKLKDYLQHMKGGGASGAGAMPSGVMPSGSNAPSQMGMPGYGYTDPTAPYASNMRPAPLGSEQGDALASCAGQLPGGYASGYGSQAGAYQPSAPSPAPSPAPQASGSPHKAPIAGNPYGAASHYYAAQQMGSTAYPNATTAGRSASTTHPSTVAATAPSITTSPSYPSTVSAAVSQPSSRYNSQNPYYGYQSSSHTTSTLSSSNNSQLKLPLGSPSPSAGASGQQNPYQVQYGYGPISSPSPGMNSASNRTGGAQPASSGGTTSSSQGYYNYYQHPSTASSGVSNIPTTMSTTSSNTQAGVTHPSYSSSATSPTAGSSNPYSYQYPQAQAATTPVATDNRGATNMTGHSSADGYMSQQGYANTTSTYYSSQTPTTQPGYSGSYATQAIGTYNGIAYQAQPPTTTPQSTGDAASKSSAYHPLSTTNGQWNTYCGYSPSSITSYTNSQAGRAGTKTSQMGGTTGTNYSYPYSHMTTVPVTTNTTASAGGGTITSQGVYSSTVPQGQAGVQYHQATQYTNVDYSKQQQWAQYRTPQSYQQPQMGASQPQHSIQPPQQQHQQLQQPLSQPQQPQQQTQHPPQQMQQQQPQQQTQHPPQQMQQQQPRLPQQQQPQQQQPQQQPQPQQQHYSQQPHQQKPQQPQQSTGISNLDLLSGIELTSPPGSQWSPLTPQPAGGGARPTSDATNTVGGEASPALPAHSGTAPDVTSTAASSNQLASNVGNTLPNIVSSNTAVTNTPSETSGAVSSSILDLTALAKRKQTVVDPLSDDEMLQRLAGETERLSKLVEGLERKSLNGPTNLDLKWKELSDMLEKECGELKVSVARCYPLKNRFADILPYDHTRVKLPSARDDYINASHVQIESTEQSFPLILTQAPMPATFIDFWTMVWEQQVEIIVCLNSEAEVKGQIYWPSDVGSSCEYGQISLTLHSSCEGGSPLSCRRVLHITHRTSKLTRVIIHMQFLGWPPSALPESPGPLLQFIADVHTFQRQQRNKLREIVVHCVPGLGRSTVFTLLSAFMRELLASGTLMDLTTLLLDLNKQRRGGIQDKEHLHFVFSAALYFAQDVLMKRGILTNKATFEEGPREKTHVRHPSADLLSAYDFSRLKSKLGLDQEGGKTGSEEHSRRNSSASLVSNGSAGFDQVLKDGQREASKESLASANSQGLTDSGCEASSVDANDTGSALESESNGLTNKPIGLLDPSFSSISPSLAASLDPQQFKIDPPVPAKFMKITKESFDNVSGGSLNKKSGDPNDPFSGLDPLWSHKKS